MTFHPSEIPDFFWEIIETANNGHENLTEILLKADKNTIYKFAGEFGSAAVALTDKRYVDRMEVTSEDSIEDICHWIVSQGKDYYEKIWNNPELIPKYDDIQRVGNLESVAAFVYEEKFGEEMPDTIDDRGYPIHNEIDL
jgi:Protein of unknown function (DUF4240)